MEAAKGARPGGGPWAELLAWYDREKRDLPWRKTRDPYRILVSEVMLQQTQVKTVLGYYHAFLERFPDLRALAEASEDQVLAAWKGLGYYRRALHLHAAAREAAARHGGELPRSYAALRAMKGIGDYTAAAVASIAFGEPKGAVDGNVLRVMARYLGIEEPVDEARTRRRIQQAVDDAVPRERPGDFNQALMELGATLCLPQRPRCDACPLEASCAARATGAGHRLPVRKRREKVKAERRIVGVVEQGGRVLLVKRPAGGLLGGMWEFLNLEPAGAPGVADEEQLRDALASLTGSAAAECRFAGRVTHRFSHLLWEMDVYRVRALPLQASEPEAGSGWTWHPVERMHEAALPRAMQKVWERVREAAGTGQGPRA